jgi:hypothetical protein
LEATGNTEVEAYYPIIFAAFLSDPKMISTLIASPGYGGGGGGGGTFPTVANLSFFSNVSVLC